MPAIQLENINFGYTRKEKILHDINLEVEKGSIYGFLGANGAGKTTTMRLILGLLKANEGRITVLGKDTKDSYPNHYNHIGSLIENSSLYAHLSAKDNLRIWCDYFDVPTSRIGEVLEIVDLSQVGKKKTEAFSTGMKQRLGLAIALLHDPEILLLDEPTNGLDPMGIRDLRNLLQRLRDDGKTIILSSHILHEVERIVTQLGIIKDGRIVFQGSINDLKELRQQNIEVDIEVKDVAKALGVLGDQYSSKVQDNLISLTIDHADALPRILSTLVKGGVDVYEFTPQRKNLEDMFLSIAKQ